MMKTVVQDVAGSGRLWTTDGPDDEPFVRTLVRGVEQAHLTICQLNQERHEDMGTTVTAVLICDAHATIVNVGDSRTYLYRQREGLWQITQDHSLVASLVVNGEITPDEVYTHPQRHQVYRSLGMDGRFIVDWFITDVYTGDRFLLCSDGLWEMVRDSAIADILGRTADVRVVSEQLVQAALAGGGADNISVVVVQVG
jgi:serine/threonine protein phosphatase PrpC